MVKIRLQRIGRKNQPAYRVVVADQRNPRDGRFIERIGHYIPTGKQEFNIDIERYQYWIGMGAQPSDRVAKIAEKVSGGK